MPRLDVFLIAAFFIIHSGDTVKPLVRRQGAVVADLDAAAVRETRRGNSFARPRRLRIAQSDTQRVHAIVLRGVDDKRAPAAAYVELPLTGLQPQLSADQVELGALGLRQ